MNKLYYRAKTKTWLTAKETLKRILGDEVYMTAIPSHISMRIAEWRICLGENNCPLGTSTESEGDAWENALLNYSGQNELACATGISALETLARWVKSEMESDECMATMFDVVRLYCIAEMKRYSTKVP